MQDPTPAGIVIKLFAALAAELFTKGKLNIRHFVYIY